MPCKDDRLSRGDAVLLLEIVNDTLSCNSEARFRSVMGRLAEVIPYQAELACLFRPDSRDPLAGMRIVNVDYPPEYLSELGRRGLIRKDPVVAKNFRCFRLQYWADTFAEYGVAPEIVSLAEDFGFRGVQAGHGYGHGVRNRAGSRGSFFCWHGLEQSRRTETILNHVVPHLHEALVRLNASAESVAPLTERELEVMKWLAWGKCTWDVSVILGISERTVKFHVSNILGKLNAETRAHAVAIAVSRGWLPLD